MRYAFWPGCVSKGAAPELYQSMVRVAPVLGIELDELYDGNCTGAGVITEHSMETADALNARNFAMAQRMGLPLINICSTCQGVQSLAQQRMKRNPALAAEVNAQLAEEGLYYDAEAGLEVKNFLWVLVEDYGLDRLKSMVKKPLTGLKTGPFYGCYIIRPEAVLGFDEHPDRDKYLEFVMEALGCTVINYDGQDKCCGFPILTINKKNSLTMAPTAWSRPARSATSTSTRSNPTPPATPWSTASKCRSCTCRSSSAWPSVSTRRISA
jgi:succinate dehydrogenase / fumarate reductase cytochrome b subunit